MSEREYAAHAGLSRGAIQKAKASGRLVLHADGSIEAAIASHYRRGPSNAPPSREAMTNFAPSDAKAMAMAIPFDPP